MSGEPIDLAEWLDRLGFENELFQFCTKPVGGAFQAIVLSNAPINMPQDRDVWVGPNPVEHVTAGRPNAEQVTRLAALHIDLDVKANGCPSFDVAHSIIDTLAGMLGTRPVAVTFSGHGLQPVWAVDGGYICDEDRHGDVELTRSAARALLRRWGRLVAHVAEQHGAKVDSLYDLPRILRAPGSRNHKYPNNIAPVVTLGDTGGPIDIDRVYETLDEYGIHETGADTRDPGTIISQPAEWAYAATTCGYAATMARQWVKDQPEARHPWLVQQAVRVAAALRNGCVDQTGYNLISAQLVNRFYQLLARDGREAGPGEISDAFGWGTQATAAMTAEHLASELGHHLHEKDINSESVFDLPRSIDSTPIQGTHGDVAPSDQGAPARPDSREEGVPTAGVAGPAQPVSDRLNEYGLPTGMAGERGPEARQEAARQESAAPAEAPLAMGGHGGTVPLTGAELAAQQLHEAAVAAKAQDLRVMADARAAEQERVAGKVSVPPLVGLGDFLATEDEPLEYRIDRLLPIGGRVMLAAQFKAGKTTAVGNLIRALADGVDFLGEFAVTAPEGSIVLVDDELDERMVRRWLRTQGITATNRVHVVSLRGRVGTFDLINPTIRAEWANNLKGVNCAVLIFDCLRPVLDALGLSEDKEAGQFLVAFDALLADAGIDEAAVVHHMGHGGERSRGDSRLRDWPDVEWRLIRDVAAGEEDPAAPRYFSAFGRDVSVAEGLLTMDEDTRHVTYDGEQTRADRKASRKAGKAPMDATADLLAHLATVSAPASARSLEATLQKRGHTIRGIRDALDSGRADGSILTEDGPRRSLLHYLNPSHIQLLSANPRVRHSNNSRDALNPRVVRHAPYVVGASHSIETHSNEGDPNLDPFGFDELFTGAAANA